MTQKPRKLKNRLMLLLLEKSRQEGRRINQIEVAKAIGVTPNTITNWINNEITLKLDIKVLESLCDYFKCEVGDLLYLESIDASSSARETDEN